MELIKITLHLEKYCDYFLNTSYTNFNKINNFIKLNNFSKKGYFFTAASQIAFLSLAKIAKKFKGNFINPDVIEKCINKKEMNLIFKKK